MPPRLNWRLASVSRLTPRLASAKGICPMVGIRAMAGFRNPAMVSIVTELRALLPPKLPPGLDIPLPPSPPLLPPARYCGFTVTPSGTRAEDAMATRS